MLNSIQYVWNYDYNIMIYYKLITINYYAVLVGIDT